ncbi:MAG: hypothetical protein R2839_02405 [Thermomicrobiales bacterium]
MAENHSTRRIVQDGGRYWDVRQRVQPYKALNLLNQLFPTASANEKITGSEQVCLYYHIKQVLAPASAPPAMRNICGPSHQRNSFSAGGDEIINPLEEEMREAADAWNFQAGR